MITVITGLPRSGTTLAMKMLEAGGIPAYYNKEDPLHTALREHPNHSKLAQHVFERQNQTYDSRWVSECEGMCVKNLMPCYYQLPTEYEYRFIWMDRDPDEHAKSNRKFVNLLKGVPIEKIESKGAYIKRHRRFTRKGLKYLRTYKNSKLMRISFEAILKKPEVSASRMADFVELDLDIDAMVKIVIPRHPRCHKGFLELPVGEHA